MLSRQSHLSFPKPFSQNGKAAHPVLRVGVCGATSGICGRHTPDAHALLLLAGEHGHEQGLGSGVGYVQPVALQHGAGNGYLQALHAAASVLGQVREQSPTGLG